MIPIEYKRLRLFVTSMWGRYTLYGSLAMVLGVPAWNALIDYLNARHAKSNPRHNRSSKFHAIVNHASTAKIITVWTIFSILVNYADTYNDLMFITKRLGRTSCACLPALLLLTLRPSPLPRTLYLSVLPIHKWLSRIVVIEGALHTALYIWSFYRLDTMMKIMKPANFYGVIAMIAFSILGITSLPKIRRKAFNVFYISHYIMTWVSVIALHFHARPNIRTFTVLNLLILIYQIIYRLWLSTKTRISVRSISPTLALIEFPTSALKKKSSLPGAHVRINNKNPFLKDFFYKLVPLAHPYTIASLPNDKAVKLIVRRGNFPLKTNRDYYITGSFEPQLSFMKEASPFRRMFEPAQTSLLGSPMRYNIDAERVFIVVGGSGISLGIPLMRILNYNGIAVRLIWVSKDIMDLNLLNNFRGLQGIECYITGDVREDEIFIDYYEDDRENQLQRVDYGSTQQDDEIDFTTIGKSYKTAHKHTDASLSRSSAGVAIPAERPKSPIPYVDPMSRFTTPRKSKSLRHHDHTHSRDDPCGFASHQSHDNTNSKPSNITVVQPEDVDAEAFKRIKIPRGVNIFYGRPNLGAEHYNWCVQSQCVGPQVTQNGETVCCRESEHHGENVDKSKIWVVTAGPAGLVDHTERWAVDGGLRYHIESFAV